MTEVPQEQVYNADTSTTPGATPTADPTAEQLQAAMQDPLTSRDDVGYLQERAAFETYVQNSGDAIPPNFQDAGAWFDSLREAQKNYTQGQQQIADLKRQYAEDSTVNPNYDPNAGQTPEAPPPAEPTSSKDNPELRIPSPTEREQEVAEMPTNDKVTNEDWSSWSMEVAVTGDLSPETRATIEQKSGFNQNMINEFLEAQKARMREAYSGAADVVGGRDRLDTLFKWAADSLSYEEQVQINVGLAGPAYEVTLRGLNEMYSKNIGAEAKSKEPQTMSNLEPSSVAQTGYTEYKTKREFYADRNNPRFKTDKAFRGAVEQRMLRTDYNKLLP